MLVSGKKTTLMSSKNFYNAMTPGSSSGLSHGKGSYMSICEDDVNSEWMITENMIPGSKTGVLNEINNHGLITYSDFCFLFLLMSTPLRHMDTVFHAYDVNADGNIEAKVRYLNQIFSGLINPATNFFRCDSISINRPASHSLFGYL